MFLGGKKQEENKIDWVLSAIKDLKIPIGRNDKGPYADKPAFQGNFNRRNRLQNYPYKLQWKDGKPIVPPTKITTKKVVLNQVNHYIQF